jgi:hypothetical protein
VTRPITQEGRNRPPAAGVVFLSSEAAAALASLARLVELFDECRERRRDGRRERVILVP